MLSGLNRMRFLKSSSLYLIMAFPLLVDAQGNKKLKSQHTDHTPKNDRSGRIDTLISNAVKTNKIPGAVVLVAQHGKIVYFKSFGKLDLNGRQMPLNAEFRIASMTKPITSVAIMMLYEQGYFLLSDPVSKYIPEFSKPRIVKRIPGGDTITVPATEEITIGQLLNHTSGITYGDSLLRPYYTKAGMTVGLLPTPGTTGQMIKKLAKLPLISEPGREFHYGMSVDVLGYLVEVLTGKPLDQYLKANIFDPLGMKDTYFTLPENKFLRLAGIYKQTANGSLEKVSKYFPYPAKQNYLSGGAGLISTAYDYSRFAQMLANGGELDGIRILSPLTVKLMTNNSIGDLFIYTSSKHNGIMGDKFGYGLAIRTQYGPFNQLESIGQYGWDGAFYTRFWVDPKLELVGIFLSQMENNWNDNLIGRFRVAVNQAMDK